MEIQGNILGAKRAPKSQVLGAQIKVKSPIMTEMGECLITSELRLKRYTGVSVLFDLFCSVRCSIHFVELRFGSSPILVTPRTCKIDRIRYVI